MIVRIEMNAKNICFGIIIIICIFALAYGIYYQFYGKNLGKLNLNEIPKNTVINEETVAFEDLFDNKLHFEETSSLSFVSKIDTSKEIVFTTYTLNEMNDGKYDIQANIPWININSENALSINREISSVFYEKINSIIDNSENEEIGKSVYTVSYSSYINENILSLVIRATLKEGNNAQRLIVKSYTYNLSSNKEIGLEKMLEIKGINTVSVENKIKTTVQEAINYSNNMLHLGYDVYNRDINNEMYLVENSNNYFLGPNGRIYIIYAYGNSNFTTECDVVCI